MLVYKVEITSAAQTDIEEIFWYIASDNKTAATKWIQEIEEQIHSLEKLPLRSPLIPESQELGREYRHIIYGNYRTIFAIKGNTVIIMRVIHSARLLNMDIFEKHE